MESTEVNNITEEQIKVIKTLIEIYKEVEKAATNVMQVIKKMWNKFLFKIHSNNKIIRKLNHIYNITKNKRIKKKQITRLYKILKE